LAALHDASPPPLDAVSLSNVPLPFVKTLWFESQCADESLLLSVDRVQIKKAYPADEDVGSGSASIKSLVKLRGLDIRNLCWWRLLFFHLVIFASIFVKWRCNPLRNMTPSLSIILYSLCDLSTVIT
jgi:hypothetical protein